MKIQVQHQVEAALQAAKTGLDMWIETNREDIRTWAENARVRAAIVALAQRAERGQATIELFQSEELAQLRAILGSVVKGKSHIGFVVFDRSGLQIAALLDEPIGKRTLSPRSDFVQRALAGEVMVSSPFIAGVSLPDESGVIKPDQPTMFSAAPVRDDDGVIIGALGFRLRPSFGFTSILEAGRIGETGETYAFNAEGLMLSNSRFLPHLWKNELLSPDADTSILAIHIRDPGGNMVHGFRPDVPREAQPFTLMAASAVKGERGHNVDGYRDYRGVPVVGAWLWVADSGFGLTSEIDVAEAYASLRDVHVIVSQILGLLALATIIGLGLGVCQQRGARRRQEAERRLAVQHEVVRVLAEAATLETTILKILQQVCVGLEWPWGSWWEMDEQAGILRSGALWNVDPLRFEDLSEQTREMTFGYGIGFPGHVWETGHALWIKDVVKASNFPRAFGARSVDLHGAILLPITFQGKILGVLEFFRESIQEQDEPLFMMLKMLGIQVGQFAERRRLETVERERAAEFESQMTAINKSQAIIEFTLDGTVLTANENLLRIMGYALEEVQGQHHRMFCESSYAESSEYQAFWAKLNRGEYDTGVYRRVGREGKVWVQATYNPIFDKRGRPYKIVKFATDITGQKVLEEVLKAREGELLEARDKAYDAVKMKGDFLATMSHEIRTPMNGVLGMTGILLESNLDTDQRECAEMVKHSADSLLTIINDILDFSKIESGKLDIEIIDFDLRVAVDEVMDLLGAKAQEKGLELVGLVYASLPTAVRGDPGRFRQILVNLVGNAIKFTQQGEVVVHIVPVQDMPDEVTLRVEVRDTGIGLPLEAQSRLFQPFSQADGSTTRKFGGTGLGLAISKQLVELMGGEIGVESAPGQGSCFWFTARLEKQSQPTERDVAAGKGLEGLRICVVDGNDTNRLLLNHYTTTWGMDCLSANDGPAALTLLIDAVAHGQPCDLLILDRQMPMMDGVELARKVKADPVLAGTRMVMLTSMGRRGDAAVMQEAGISAYLTKPIHQYQLRDCLLMVMNPTVGGETLLVTKHSLLEATQRKEGRLLVADDNIVNQKVAVRMLERLGYRVDVVANGLEAVEAVSRISYHAVLMDCQMPEMDGYEATREIRRREESLVARRLSLEKHEVRDTSDEQPATSDQIRATSNERPATLHVPIIAMTANAMKGDREKCLNAGMDDFVSKPVKPEELEAVLDRWVRKKETSLVAGRLSLENHEIRATSDQILSLSHERRATSDDSQDPPLDAVALDGLKELSGDDPSFLGEVIQQFLHDGPAHVAAIRQAVSAGDADALMKAAHGFKGSCRNMGALPLGELCCTLEEKGRAGETSSWEDVLKELEHEYARVQIALEAERVELSVGRT